MEPPKSSKVSLDFGAETSLSSLAVDFPDVALWKRFAFLHYDVPVLTSTGNGSSAALFETGDHTILKAT